MGMGGQHSIPQAVARGKRRSCQTRCNQIVNFATGGGKLGDLRNLCLNRAYFSMKVLDL